MPDPETSNPELATALAMTGADIAQNELGLDGRGVRVAVMDTGVDIDHPDFGGNGTNGSTPFPTARVVTGWDFVGDAFNADPASATYNPVTTPDAIPDDCAGHGSHVAGIIGADGTVKGVAPKVSIGAYRVFGCQGSTTADVMLAAMERALADDMDVLNMSIGSTYQWPEYPTAKACHAPGQPGHGGGGLGRQQRHDRLYSTGAPSVGDKVISVASFDNTRIYLSGLHHHAGWSCDRIQRLLRCADTAIGWQRIAATHWNRDFHGGCVHRIACRKSRRPRRVDQARNLLLPYQVGQCTGSRRDSRGGLQQRRRPTQSRGCRSRADQHSGRGHQQHRR
jgi:hypothetical protein